MARAGSPRPHFRTKVLLCLDVGVRTLKRHLNALGSGESCVWGWSGHVVSGPQDIIGPGGMGAGPVVLS